MKMFIILDAKDDVATAIKDLRSGYVLQDPLLKESVILQQDIPHGHKVALHDIEEGTTVAKYGVDIGMATADIKQGELVHVHNLRSTRGKGKAASR